MINLVGNKKQILVMQRAISEAVPVVPNLLNVTFLLPGDQHFAVKTGKYFFYLVGGKNSIITKDILKSYKPQFISIYYKNT